MDQKAKQQKTPTTERAPVQQNLGPLASKYLACLTEQISGFGWSGAQRQEAIEKHSKAVAGAEKVLSVLPAGTQRFLFNFHLTPFGPERIQATDRGFSIFLGRDEITYPDPGWAKEPRRLKWENFSGRGDEPRKWAITSNAAGNREWHVSIEEPTYVEGGYTFEVYNTGKRTMNIAKRALLDLEIHVPEPRTSEYLFSLPEISVSSTSKNTEKRQRDGLPESVERMLMGMNYSDSYKERIMRGEGSIGEAEAMILYYLSINFNKMLIHMLDTAKDRLARHKASNVRASPEEKISELIYEEGPGGKTWTAKVEKGDYGLANEKWTFRLQGTELLVFKDDEAKPRATLEVVRTACGEVRVFRPNKIGDEIFDLAFLKKTRKDPVATALVNEVGRWVRSQNLHLYPDLFNYAITHAQDQAYNVSRAREILDVLPPETAMRLMETILPHGARVWHHNSATGFFVIRLMPEEIGVSLEKIEIPGFTRKEQPNDLWGERLVWEPSKHEGRFPHAALGVTINKETNEPTGFGLSVRESDEEGIRHAQQILKALSIQAQK